MLLSEFDQKLLQEWDYEKNNELNIFPDKITYRSGKKVWWKCSKNHSYQTTIINRTNINKSKCPYCSNHKVLKGYNDLLSNFPDICKDWDYELNTIRPDEITSGSHKTVYWKCNKGHSWTAAVYSRTSIYKTGCPECKKGLNTSFGEQCIYYYLLPYNAKNRFKLDNMEIDIYLPEMNIGIEFNGNYWHKDRKEKDLIKELKLSHKVTMYYVCESNKNEIKGNKIFFNKENYNLNLEWAIKTLFNILNLNIDVNIKRDEQLIYKNSVYTKKENSLAYKHPELLKEWDYKKNTIKPDEITKCSNKKVWWKCLRGHSYQATVNNNLRINKSSCPYCSGHKLLKGFNDLLSRFPELCKEWNYELNTINPDEITSGSHKKVYWKCNKGHSWQTTINSRTSGKNCPYCSNNKILKGYNDLLSKFPDICQEWDYELNIINPDKIAANSHKKVYWKCNKGHSWETKVYSRTRNNSGCPYCAKKDIPRNLLIYDKI